MIPLPNARLLELVPAFPVEHVIFNCEGATDRDPAAAATRGAAVHRPVTAAHEKNPATRAPAATTQVVPGPLVLAAERDGPGTGWGGGRLVPRGRSVLAGEASPTAHVLPDDVAARLAEPPSLLHPLTWLRYHARRRP